MRIEKITHSNNIKMSTHNQFIGKVTNPKSKCNPLADTVKISGYKPAHGEVVDGMREFETGAHRDTSEGKLIPALIPQSSLKRVSKRYTDGANKYGVNNWTKGMEASEYYNSASRHLDAWWNGDEDEDHLAAVAWNIMSAMWTMKNKPELDNRKKFPK